MSVEQVGRTLITGGTKGIGLGIARAFLDNGDDVALLYGHDREAAERALASLQAGDRAVAVQCDVADAQALQRVIGEVWEQGPLRCLVNNAARMNRTGVLDITLEEWQQIMDTNLRGYFVAAQAFARLAVRHGREGVIVNISSTGQVHALPNQMVYQVAKGGVAMLTRTFALELAPHHINVNAVAPGTIRTEINREIFAADRAFREDKERKIPLGRLGDPSDVAPAVVFLASPAASFITGATLFVDGGSTIW
jgi:NAD(P)-dependent dehydrogenase (short-subunit alcohol dehydrogenase family)